MARAYFITACGTGIGKSFVTAALTHAARLRGVSVAAYKPILSGFDAAQLAQSDSALLLEAAGLPVDEAHVAAITPWRYAAPLSPNMAARMQGQEIDVATLVQWCQQKIAQAQGLCLLEGVGGAMVPLNAHHTVRDWLAGLHIPAALVTGSYLGSISHTLTAVEALHAKNIPIAAVVVNATPESTVPLAETLATLRGFLPAETSLVALSRAANYREAEISPLLDLLVG